MTIKCPYCNSEIEDSNPVLALEAIKTYVEQKGGWSIFESARYDVGTELPMGEVTGRIVASKTSYDPGEIDRSSYYDSELPQGTTFEVYVVLSYRDGFFKKTGTGDSYGEITWDGELRPVTLKTKVVEVYDYV
jgi:hypothetical protein